MTDPSSAETSLSLLKRLRLRPTDEGAWNEFVERYGRRIVGWCRYWGLQDSDAADVSQTVLMRIAKNIARFDKQKGSFRGWLKTISHNAWADLVKSRQHKVAKGGDALWDRLQSVKARDDLAREIESAWQQELMELATNRVQLRVQPKTWRAFELTAVENVSGQEASEQLEMPLTAIYKAKSNVIKMLQAEVQSLEQTEFV